MGEAHVREKNAVAPSEQFLRFECSDTLNLSGDLVSPFTSWQLENLALHL
jgi:hypothetical protein